MIVSIKRARTVFVAALACYLLWVGALAPEPVAVPVAP
jgi:hypothetical protein